MSDKKKILVVDDDADVAQLIRVTLSTADRVIVTARDGVEAIEKAFTEAPDLIILDVMMPKMNGYQVCRLLKNDRCTWEIPVLMLSAKARDKDRSYGLSVGADDFFTKPFTSGDLRTKVSALLAGSEGMSKSRPAGNMVFRETDLLSRVNQLLDRKLQELTFIQTMTRSIISTFDEDKILGTVIRGIGSEAGYSVVAAMMELPDRLFRIGASSGFNSLTNGDIVKRPPETVMKRLAEHGEPVVLMGNDILSEPEPVEGSTHHQCLVPITFRDEFIGAILIDRQVNEPPFSDERLGLLEMISGQLALALGNASLYRSTLQRSITDGLTGIYNNRYFYDRLEKEIIRTRRYGHQLSLLMFDLDFFKMFNDTYGHLCGDDALRAVADILRQECRETDTAARYGGEEFCVILPETDVAAAELIGERIRGMVESCRFSTGSGNNDGGLTVSVGVATLTPDLESGEGLVKKADKALYMSKKNGRNRVSTFV